MFKSPRINTDESQVNVQGLGTVVQTTKEKQTLPMLVAEQPAEPSLPAEAVAALAPDVNLPAIP